jgi:Ca2+-binding RTX toxin-like protein
MASVGGGVAIQANPNAPTFALSADQSLAATLALSKIAGTPPLPQNVIPVTVTGSGGSSLPAPTPGQTNIYEVYNLGSTPKTDKLPEGGQALIVTGVTPEYLVGHTGQEVLVGNAGADTINAAGGSGTVITGNGNNTILLNDQGVSSTGGMKVQGGTGSDTIKMWGGSVTVTAQSPGTITVDALANANTVIGNAQIYLSQGASVYAHGSDTISFGDFNDTVTSFGTATASSALSGLTLMTGTGAHSVMAGSGNTTLIGGSGTDTFVGGAGTSSMVGGTSTNLFVGGAGFDTMVGNGIGGDNTFTFDTSHGSGGNLDIYSFTTGDDLKLVNYDVSSVLADATVSGGNTILDLGGTIITVHGHVLTSSDITTS